MITSFSLLKHSFSSIINMVNFMGCDYKFKTAEELYNRVLPALRSKANEFKRDHISYVSEKDIWNYLSKTEWRKKQDLEFYELVDSILNLTIADMEKYLIEKINKSEKNEDSIL